MRGLRKFNSAIASLPPPTISQHGILDGSHEKQQQGRQKPVWRKTLCVSDLEAAFEAHVARVVDQHPNLPELIADYVRKKVPAPRIVQDLAAQDIHISCVHR